MKCAYTVSQEKESGLWYAHMTGYSYIPSVINGRDTFHKSHKYALKNAAIMMELPYEEYMQIRRHKNGRSRDDT